VQIIQAFLGSVLVNVMRPALFYVRVFSQMGAGVMDDDKCDCDFCEAGYPEGCYLNMKQTKYNKCGACNATLHERDGHYCIGGIWR